ncbi:MAG: hypothetical protein E7177_04430 [Erysipelotrichaceae bacterium]|nr:hypothetical protein [Erysipelotrichaceae bacterium]
MVVLLNLMINGLYIYFLISILISQYYNIKRFLKVIFFNFLKKENLILFACSSLSFCFYFVSKYLFYLVSFWFLVIFFFINKPIIFKFTRRNILLYIVSFLLGGLILSFTTLGALLSLLIGYYLLLPFEFLNNKRYKRKAKEKLESLDIKVIGITGSYGKTTFKNMLYHVLKTTFNVSMPKGNINTPLGICKFINNSLKDNVEVLLLELGIDEVKGMKKFKDFLSLDIGVITSIGENHLSTFKSIENTKKAKLKISELLKKDGKLYLNKDSFYLKNISLKENYEYFSNEEYVEKEITIEGVNITYNDKEIRVPLYGSYVYSYINGIIKISEFLGINKDFIALGLSEIKPIDRRLQLLKYKDGYIINDSYNINLSGVKESLTLLKGLSGSKVVVLGGIIEQGKYYYLNNVRLSNLLSGMEVIFVGSNNHPLISNHNFSKLFITSSLSQAYKLIEENNYKNVLLLAKSEDIFLK